jgi:hypothetical protein
MLEFANGRFTVTFECKDCEIPERTRTWMQDELEHIGRVTEEMGKRQLWVTVVFHARSGIYRVRAKFKAPGRTVMTGDNHPLLDEALRRCLAKAFLRMEAFRDNLDQGSVEQAKRREALSDNLVAPTGFNAGAISRACQDGDYEAFRRGLIGHESWVRMRVGRWIQRYPEIQQEVGESFEISDLMEEVFLLAFERYQERPDEVPLHEWLDKLIDPAVRDFWNDPDEREAASFAQTLVGEPRT